MLVRERLAASPFEGESQKGQMEVIFLQTNVISHPPPNLHDRWLQQQRCYQKPKVCLRLHLNGGLIIIAGTCLSCSSACLLARLLLYADAIDVKEKGEKCDAFCKKALASKLISGKPTSGGGKRATNEKSSRRPSGARLEKGESSSGLKWSITPLSAALK